MSNSAQRKYTDRDVRENLSQVSDLVEEYLEKYEGEFEFLVDCKMRIAAGYGLTSGMLRGVLNCMRVDARYRGPLPEFVDLDTAEVIEMPTKQRKKKKEKERVTCPLLEAGIFHSHKGGSYQDWWDAGIKRCDGLYRINRSAYDRPARLKTELVKAKSVASVKIHRADPLAYFTWSPKAHAYGWHNEEYSWSRPTSLSVHNPRCIGARWLRDPILLTQQMIDEHNEQVTNEEQRWVLCARCWES